MSPLRCLAWYSDERSERLTPEEVESLFNTTQQLNTMGMLSNGKYKGASVSLFWVRLSNSN